MSFEFVLMPSVQRLLPPSSGLGWLVWLGWLFGLLFVLWRQVGSLRQWGRRDWVLLLILALTTPLAQLLLVLHLPTTGMLPIPGLGSPVQGVWLPLLGALPWMLAAAWLGALPAGLLGGLAGVILGLWNTRSPFTALEVATLATLLGLLLHQNYRSRFFAGLRRPLPAAILLSILYPALYAAAAFFWAGDSLAASLDFTLSRLGWATLSIAGQLLTAALALHVIQSRLPELAPKNEERTASPAELSLERRLLFALGPVVLLLFLALGALAWFTAGQAADQLIEERVQASVEIAADGVPFLLETGQTLIQQLGRDPRLLTGSHAEVTTLLADQLSAVPYFEQFVLLDTFANSIAGFPVGDLEGLQPGQRELDAVQLALQGVPLQFFSIPPLDAGSNAAQLSFVAAVRDGYGQISGVLVGRTRLSTNPFAQPVIKSLQSLYDLGGQGLLLDGEGRIVFSQASSALLADYNGRTDDSALAYEDTSPDGERRLVIYQPATGSAWAVVARVPASLSQQLALNIVLPMLLVFLAMAVLAYALLRVSLRTVTGSLQDLVSETRRIAAGDLDAPLSVRSADEVGRLGQAFEEMRQRLKGRMEENQRLLTVSQGVASSLEVRSHIDPILDAALASGAQSARLVFGAAGLAGFEGAGVIGFGRGELSESYQSLDAQILNLTKAQQRVLLTNPARARLVLPQGVPAPQALAAFALQHEGEHLGTLWLAYDQPQQFGAEPVRYLETLAGQAALAAANARLYLNARIGRQRMEAVLAATPDPVLVTDQGNRLLLANPAALKLLGLDHVPVRGALIEDIARQKELLALFQDPGHGASSGEVHFGRDQVYYATVTPIEVDGESMGSACVLRDITQFRQAEALRSEFLSTVSHDLRDPLELIGGYITMLDMVGDLNEQQHNYSEKIEQSARGLSSLVDNLLDLERIERGQGLKLESLSLAAMIEQTAEELLPRARQKQVEIVIEPYEGEMPSVEGDRTLLQRAFYNLLDNAVKFSPRGENVHIWLAPSPQAVTVAIKDQGVGIAPVDLPHIFERLYRPNQTVEDARGGLGLAIVRSIIERHQGRVWADSELGLGSTFYAQLPIEQNTA